MNDRNEKLGWFVLQLKPNGLSLARTHLARQGFLTLMPLREVSQHARYGLRTVRQPLFPGYLFFSVTARQINWPAAANTRGVTRIVVGTDGQPARLPADIAAGLLAITTEDGMLGDVADLQTGDQVGVVNGPFAGWMAKVVSADTPDRIQLLVDVMGRETAVNIAGRDLEKRY
ncbi:transcriptional antitermination protein, putative [Roseobacter sp. CCS2]|nr:transcriptional activator RfaH [Roseobacter sp. CCS2]EBA13983.1 transcriptional antitermination protein, putative [Roseobacter sp. CCS2]